MTLTFESIMSAKRSLEDKLSALSPGLLPSFPSALRIVEDDRLLDYVGEDWSKVRSPGRAKRRRKRGFKQNIKAMYAPKKEAYRVGNTLYMHPAMAAEARKLVPPR